MPESAADNSGKGGGGALLGAIVGGASSLINSLFANRSQKKAIEANKKAAELEYKRQIEMWNMQNAYNDPSAQMARLKAAGLNPNLVYGGGQVTGNTTGNYPKYNAPVQDPVTPVTPDFQGMYVNYQDARMRQAQIDNLKAQTALTDTKNVTEAFNSTLKEWSGKEKYKIVNEMQDYQAEILYNRARASQLEAGLNLQKLTNMQYDEQQKLLNLEYTRAKMSQVEIDKEKKQAELVWQKYQNQLAKDGITSGDNVLLRLLVRLANKNGVDVMEFLDRPLAPEK